MAHSASYVDTWHLKRVSKWKSEKVSTDGGWYRITIPWGRPGWDSLGVAQRFFEVAMHEWKHIADYQARLLRPSSYAVTESEYRTML